LDLGSRARLLPNGHGGTWTDGDVDPLAQRHGFEALPVNPNSVLRICKVRLVGGLARAGTSARLAQSCEGGAL
jgi:hypothetical protein